MRTFKNWTTSPESIESMCAARRYNKATELHISRLPKTAFFAAKCYTVTLGAGTSDELDIFIEGQRIYALSTNQGLGYVGLQVFEDGEEVAETFIDNGNDQGEYILGLTPIWRAKRLADWCDG